MAGRYGNIFDSLLEGIQAGEQMQSNAQRRKAEALGMQEAQLRLDAAKEARANEESTKWAMTRAMNPDGPAPGMGPQQQAPAAPENWEAKPAQAQAPRPRIFEAYEKVAQDAFARGDAATGQRYLDASAAQKTMHYTNAVNAAIKSRDANALAAILSDQPLDPYEYRIGHGPDGSLSGARYNRTTGELVGAPTKFESFDHAAAMVQRAINPGDLTARLAAAAKQKMDEDVARSNISRNDAQNAKDNEAAAGQKLSNALLEQFGGREAQAKINQAESQAASARANANHANASAGVVGQTPEMRNFQFSQSLSPDARAEFVSSRRGADGVLRDPVLQTTADIAKSILSSPVGAAGTAEDAVNKAREAADAVYGGGSGLLRKSDVPKGAPAMAGALGKKPAAIPTVRSMQDYARIPSGTQYKDPEGNTRTKK